MGERLGNTVIENHMLLNSMNSEDDHVCFIQSLKKCNFTPEDAYCAGLCAILWPLCLPVKALVHWRLIVLFPFPTLHLPDIPSFGHIVFTHLQCFIPSHFM